jgi:hypothetical protein
MGRFTETSQPHFIDKKMYQAPAELELMLYEQRKKL